MNPVKGYTMLNFIHWVALHHPEIQRLRDTPEDELLDLVDEFEQGKLGGNQTLREKWKSSFHFLLKDTMDWEGYGDARKELARLEGGSM